MDYILLRHIDPEKRKWRFYAMRVVPGIWNDWILVREWGRIGQGGTVRFESFAGEEDARDAMKQMKRAKEKKGYRWIDLITA